MQAVISTLEEVTLLDKAHSQGYTIPRKNVVTYAQRGLRNTERRNYLYLNTYTLAQIAHQTIRTWKRLLLLPENHCG